jgi:PAS domain S-box-containing protein
MVMAPQNLQQAVLNTLDALVVVLDRHGQIVQFNQACEASTGYAFAEVEGKTIWDTLSISEEIEAVKTTFANLNTHDGTSQHENVWVTKTGERRLIAWSSTTLINPQDHLRYIISTGTDITERRHNEVVLKQQIRYEQLWGEIAAHIRQSLDLDDILNTTVTEVRQVLETDRVLIFRFEPDWSGKVLVESLGSGPWLSAFEMHIRDTCFASSYVKRYQTGRTKAIEDILQAGLTPCHIEFLQQFQVRANLVVPILQGEQLWGLLIAHHCSGPRQWQPQDVTLLTRLATQLAIALQQSELYQQLQTELTEREQVEVVLQEARKDLERRVTERTTELIGLNQQLNLELVERKEAEAALEQLSHQNELILNAMGEGLCGLNLQAQFTFVNAAAEHYLGYTAMELIDQSIELLLPEAHEPDVFAPVSASLQTGTTQTIQNATFCRKNRSCFPVEYLTTPILERGEIVGAVITFKDISDRQLMERMKDEFISVVSHELRTPLTSIHGSLRMLASGMLSAQPDKSQRLLKIAAESTDRLVRLINDILDVERIESGQVRMTPQICSAGDLMVQAANTMQGMANKMGVTLSVHPLSEAIWADPDRIVQTFTNLLSNAIKFSAVGSTIWFKAIESQSSHPNAICFSIQDQGRGIPADKIDLIFERFQQADSSDTRNHEGTGLGLSICRSIVRQHGGEIWVESQLGQGSCFYFTIPCSSLASLAVSE